MGGVFHFKLAKKKGGEPDKFRACAEAAHAAEEAICADHCTGD